MYLWFILRIEIVGLAVSCYYLIYILDVDGAGGVLNVWPIKFDLVQKVCSAIIVSPLYAIFSRSFRFYYKIYIMLNKFSFLFYFFFFFFMYGAYSYLYIWMWLCYFEPDFPFRLFIYRLAS